MGKGTKAPVAYFDGASRSPVAKKVSAGSTPGNKLSEAKGKPAGGTDSPRNTRKSVRGSVFSAPESGSAKFTPAVSKHDGKSVPKSVARKPK